MTFRAQVAPLLAANDAPGLVAGYLCAEVYALFQAGLLEQRGKLHLAPVALHLAVALEGLRELPCLVADALVEGYEAVNLTLELGTGGVLAVGTLAHEAVEVLQVASERLHHVLHLAIALSTDSVGLPHGELLRQRLHALQQHTVALLGIATRTLLGGLQLPLVVVAHLLHRLVETPARRLHADKQKDHQGGHHRHTYY